MVGRPRARARREAALIEQGVAPATWTDDRPMKAAPQRERGWDLIKERQDVDTAKLMSGRSSPASDEAPLEILLGGLVAEDLDGESNAEFEALRKLGFAFAREVMELPLVATDKNFAKILQIKSVITQAVLTATTRLRPNDLRDKEDDGVGALLDQLREESVSGVAQNARKDDQRREDDAEAEARARAELLS